MRAFRAEVFDDDEEGRDAMENLAFLHRTFEQPILHGLRWMRSRG